ncbi:DUF2254 domain-containing protein [Blastococcus haudaquaticus]|uniref:Uncharacterized membrane protein n=1 Tax=Blastococcus haudaquaticus TaxID=1938745 RepID=A0A286GRC7_9ACTN|nr:DUF2254 domain-containing protein [Blastococcus haudaquaticus]SOD98117.1 Uncharacterized membrane protein [Blastococcus haudaquaticus]
MTGRRGLAAAVWARLGSSLWPLPVLGIVVAIALGVALPALDALLEEPGGDHPLTFAFGGGPSAARDLLAAIAGSLISVTGLTFSFTVVALQLSSSQHSPRLLQTFVTDRVVQATLAQLVGTFVYALTVLRTVRTEDATSRGAAFVPRLSVTVGFALTLVSVVALVLFLGHLARSLRVETMLRDVHDEATATYGREVPSADREDAGAGAPPVLPAGPGRLVGARSSGFVVDVDPGRLVAAAQECDAVVRLTVRIGDSVVAGTPVAQVWAGAGAGADLEDALLHAVRLGFERSPARDIAYSLRKVVDIAVRALSPGTNDPTTAVHAMSHVSALLGDLAGRPLGPLTFRDDDDRLRLVVPPWELTDLVQVGLEEPLQFASGQPAVLRRIARLLRELAWRTPRGTLDSGLRAHLDRVVDLARETTSVDPDETERWRREFDDALAGRWTPHA